ncbi:MAG: hypothetical protein BJ554DRAFT_774 [Olpidium bornovanus]|uniref:Uncharacterized protein n=1 Tax=Olpidium bornovanus TaxID=278681 RepID=A0A8H8DHY1_9FUNG|nr:MAG: hypothetical protein BJ554DRAFT_774 [Olpidium bornovanus]
MVTVVGMLARVLLVVVVVVDVAVAAVVSRLGGPLEVSLLRTGSVCHGSGRLARLLSGGVLVLVRVVFQLFVISVVQHLQLLLDRVAAEES